MLLRRFSGNRPEEIERSALDTFHVLLQSISWGLGDECSQKLKYFVNIFYQHTFQSHLSVVLVEGKKETQTTRISLKRELAPREICVEKNKGSR